MSRKKATREVRSGSGFNEVRPRKPRRTRLGVRGGTLLGVGILLAVGFCAGWRWQQQKMSLPSIDLRGVDPIVASSLQSRMDEVRRHPRSGDAWGWLGALLRAYNFRPAACQCLSQAARFDPANPRWPYHHALALIIATPNDAIPLFEKAVRLCGNVPEGPRFRLAQLLAEQGRWDEARIHVDSLLAERPDFAPARLLAARAAHARGELDRAGELARRCADDPRTARGAWSLLSVVHWQKGDGAAATQASQRSSGLPADEGFGDVYQAEVTLLRGDPRVLSEQAHSLLASGHLAEAAVLIDRLRQEHSDYSETWLLVGRLQLLRQELTSSEKSIRRHLELCPSSAQGLFQLGLVLLAQERFPDAAQIFEQATRLKNDYGPAHYNLGFALGRSGKAREAIAAFRESLRHNPERLEAYILLADLHLRLGERDVAVAVLNQAQSLNSEDPRLRTLRDRASVVR